MSFRFVGTALAILSTSTSSGYYLANGMPAGTPRGTTVVVPVSQAEAQARSTIKAVVSADSAWRPRVWVGYGVWTNPMTGAPLTREEQESGWVDAPSVFAREIVHTVTDPTTGAQRLVREPNPEVLVLKHGEKAPAWVRGTKIALAPGIEIEAASPPPQARAPAQATANGRVQTAAQAKMDAGYRIHLESFHNDHMIGQAWTRLQKANPTVLGSLQPSTMTVNIPKKGKFVRLLAGSFENKEAAEKACVALKKSRHHQYCHPLAPGHEAT